MLLNATFWIFGVTVGMIVASFAVGPYLQEKAAESHKFYSEQCYEKQILTSIQTMHACEERCVDRIETAVATARDELTLSMGKDFHAALPKLCTVVVDDQQRNSNPI